MRVRPCRSRAARARTVDSLCGARLAARSYDTTTRLARPTAWAAAATSARATDGARLWPLRRLRLGNRRRHVFFGFFRLLDLIGQLDLRVGHGRRRLDFLLGGVLRLLDVLGC